LPNCAYAYSFEQGGWLVKFGGAGRRDNCRLGDKVLYRTLWLSAGNEEIKNARTRSVGEPHQEILRNRN
jgi:hypothetical protein